MARLCIGDDHPKYKKWEKQDIEQENYWDSGYPYVDFYQGKNQYVARHNDVGKV